MSTPTAPHPCFGDRVTVRLGGQTFECTIGAQVVDADGKVKVRSTTKTDHIWTQMWMSLGCIVSQEG